jgi:hypothetical protein
MSRFTRWPFSELLYVSSEKLSRREMTEIMLAMDFDESVSEEEANTEIADPQHSPEIRRHSTFVGFANSARWQRNKVQSTHFNVTDRL